jgi:ATP-dependent helicase STH1/SNF2
LQELVDRARGKKERRAANKLIKDSDTPGRGTPASDVGGRRGKKGKGKMAANDYDTPVMSGKRKRGMKSMSVTPSMNEDDDDERDMVSNHLVCSLPDVFLTILPASRNDGRRRRVNYHLQ